MASKFLRNLHEVRGIPTDKKYYAKNYQENIYPETMDEIHIRMFCRGGGKELYPTDGTKEKAACIYSSSMLSYNFFHWINEKHPLTLFGIKFTKVVFEEQFRVLKNRNNKANIDVVLISEDGETLLAFESKFTEHLHKGPATIKEAYDNSGNYFSDGENWVKVINYLRSNSNKESYQEGLKQVTCHLIGISNVMRDRTAIEWFNKNSWLSHLYHINISDVKKIIFKSLVFHPNTEIEGTLSEDYEILNREFVSKQINFVPKELILENPIITYKDLWDEGMRDSIRDPELKKYLEKYLSAHVE
jgi:hypothetical protein